MDRTKIEPDIELADAGWWQDVIDGMEAVLSGREGTARRSGQGLKYRMAGKSGTAQVFSLGKDEKYNAEELAERLRDHALFMAFAPVEDPQIAVAVIVENAGGGSSHAAHLARAMADKWLLDFKHLPRLQRAGNDNTSVTTQKTPGGVEG